MLTLDLSGCNDPTRGALFISIASRGDGNDHGNENDGPVHDVSYEIGLRSRDVWLIVSSPNL